MKKDDLVWYDIPLGTQRRYPDFIILHPSRGLLFLEVKDWSIETLRSITHEHVELRTDKGHQKDSNPLKQARQCGFAAIGQLERDPQLVQTREGYQGKLCLPYGHGVVFPFITRKEWDQYVSAEEQELLLPAHRLICRDEMYQTGDPDTFQQRLLGMLDYQFGEGLNAAQIDRIRWQLFPEVRIDAAPQDLFDQAPDDRQVPESGASEIPAPDIVRVLDLQQEQLARSMGNGHRVIHGVAGSGKTLILGYRCQHLAQTADKPILVMCFNITLAARLRAFIADKGIGDSVQVHHFHEWCKHQLKTHRIRLPPSNTPAYEHQVETVIEAVEDSRIPQGQYGAVMIDEGHDFKQSWLQLAVQMVDPDTNSLLLLYDDAQSIYQKNSLAFPLSAAGIQARGRTTILRLNYRNSREILTFAYDFARDFMQIKTADEDHIPLIAPEVAGVSGPEPAFYLFSSAAEEAHYLVRCIRKWQGEGSELNSIAVVYTSNARGRFFHTALQRAGIPSYCPQTQANKRRYNPLANEVVLLSRQSSKGLEFDTVLLCGLGTLQNAEDRKAQEARLLYVGMTRARRRLMITSCEENWCTQRLTELDPRAA